MIFGLFPVLLLGGLLGGSWLFARKRLSVAGAAVSAGLVYLGTMLVVAAGVFFGLLVSGGHDPSPMFTFAAIFGGAGLLFGAPALFFYIPSLLVRAKTSTIGALAMVTTPLVAFSIGNIFFWALMIQVPALRSVYWLTALLSLAVGGWGGWKLNQLELTSQETTNPLPPEA